VGIPIVHVYRNQSHLPAKLRPASLRQRIIAQLIDGIVLGAAVAIWLAWISGGNVFSLWISPLVPVYLLQVAPHWLPSPTDWWWGGLFLEIPLPYLSSPHLAYPSPILWLLYAIYYTFFTARYGQTPGKMLKGLVVLDERGQFPSLYRSFLRWLWYIPSLLLLGMGFWYGWWGREGQTWGDRFARTKVYYFLPFDHD